MSNWALILGASSGIGASCARELAKQGINIYGVYLRKKSDVINELTNELESYGGEVIYKKRRHALHGDRISLDVLNMIYDTCENIVEEVINENQKMVEQYLSGKDKLLGFFDGQAMKKSKGKANPKILNEILK